MPYGFVLIKELPEHWEVVGKKLREYSLQGEKGIEMFKETNTALLNWYRCFGWADFIAVVWSPNVECIKNWILKFREEFSKAMKNDEAKLPITTTIIGVEENEFEDRINELELFKKLISEQSDEVIKEFNIVRLSKYLENLKKNIEDMLKQVKNMES